MLRLRRSRIVITISLISCFLFYNLYSKTQAYEWAKSQTGLATPYGAGSAAQAGAKPVIQEETVGKAAIEENLPVADALIPTTTTKLIPTTTSVPAREPVLVLDTSLPPKQTQPTKPIADIDPEAFGKALGGPPKYGLPTSSSSSESTTSNPTPTSDAVHWTKMPEFFPVPTTDMITLPTGKAKKLSQIQYDFKDETALEKGTREKRQAQILATFKKSWKGYEDFAWLHDELSPKSGKFRDPFCGWAATLIDSLDSLVIMGLDKEFHRALEALEQIDFTFTTKAQIPLFETTIRYLGGLLSAYDMSGQQYKILLDKAKELGEVLYGAFDTPNRMPQTFYSWRKAFVMNPHRASTRVVMAELGSLSMEFTRLAQLTGDEKYYDAIARITNEMELFQSKTKLPGLWPMYIDASGCKKPDRVDGKSQHWRTMLDTTNSELRDASPDEMPPSITTIVAGVNVGINHSPVETSVHKHDHGPSKGKIANWDEHAVDTDEGGKVPTRHADSPVIGTNSKRQLDSAPMGVPDHDRAPVDSVSRDATTAKIDCQPQGLASPPGMSAGATEEFTFGGMADSTYEYLPKQFALLGGLVPQYKSMYEDSIEAANKHLLFRPMTPTNEDILVLGKAKSTGVIEDLLLVPELGHLLCFAGGMYGLGAKMFDRPKDLELAKKMTDSCVWAYSITPTGIMPEGMDLLKCDSMDNCKWNQTLWEDTLDPFPENRIADGLKAKQHLLESIGRDSKAGLLEHPPQGDTPSRADTRAEYLQNKAALPVEKRQLGAIENDVTEASADSPYGRFAADPKSGALKSLPAAKDPNVTPTTTSASGDSGTVTHSDARTFAHSDYVEYRMRRERLPKGVPAIGSRKYILRPEAIESVFYMYRITGDASWREKGWKMFEAVQAATDTTHGASAIHDVTAEGDPTKLDEMESFWLAETLKYFYLLFSDEKVVSLDEWVMNTEAHPFKRPQPA